MGEDDEKVDKLFMVSCILAFFLSTMVQTVLQIIFPTIERELHMTSSESNIVVFLPIAALFITLIPISVLADRFGKRRMFEIGLALMCLAMVCSAASFDFYSLAISRILTGMSAACLTCTVLSLVTDNSPRRILALCLGLCTAGSSVGATIAPSLGNVINEWVGWRWIFVFTFAGLIIAFILMRCSSCANNPDSGRKVDITGMLLFVIGAFCFVIGLDNIPLRFGFINQAIGIAILALFFYRESRRGEGTFKLSLLRNRFFTTSCLVAVVFYMCTIAVTYWGCVYMISIGDIPMAEISLMMAIAPLIQAIFSPLVAQLGTRYNPMHFPIIGLFIVALALALLIFCPYDRSHLEMIIPALILSAVSYAFFAVENNRNIMLTVKEGDRNFASSMIGSMTALGRYAAMAFVSCIAYIAASQTHFTSSDLHTAFAVVFPVMIFLCLLSMVACYRVKEGS